MNRTQYSIRYFRRSSSRKRNIFNDKDSVYFITDLVIIWGILRLLQKNQWMAIFEYFILEFINITLSPLILISHSLETQVALILVHNTAQTWPVPHSPSPCIQIAVTLRDRDKVASEIFGGGNVILLLLGINISNSNQFWIFWYKYLTKEMRVRVDSWLHRRLLYEINVHVLTTTYIISAFLDIWVLGL